jgi:hypothetical protein
MAADDDAPRYPLWTYGLVGVAMVLAVLWLVGTVIGFLLGLIKLAVVIVLAGALVAWALGKKADRG